MKKSNLIGRSLEKRFAKKVKGRTTFASGALWFDKEDVQKSNWLFQSKATDGVNFLLKLKDIKKLESNAAKTHRNWGLVVEYSSSDVMNRTAYVVIPFKLLGKIDDKFNAYTIMPSGIVESKQIKISKDVLDECWLNDSFYAIRFKAFDSVLLILNELDFLKAFRNELNEV